MMANCDEMYLTPVEHFPHVNAEFDTGEISHIGELFHLI